MNNFVRKYALMFIFSGSLAKIQLDPGCAVDIPGFCYSYSFAPNPDFTQMFPSQAEILQYLSIVAKRYRVDQHFRGGVEWIGATWQEDTHTWIVTLKDIQQGRVFTQECQVLISAVGGLVNPQETSIAGAERFRGEIIHTARWKSSIDLKNKHVAVIGNGASASQVIPAIIGETSSVTQFMRSPHHIVEASNHQISLEWRSLFRRIPIFLYLIRLFLFLYMEVTWFLFQNNRLAKIGRNSVENSSRKNSMRLTADPIAEIKSKSIVTCSGEEVYADVILLATGFALTHYDVDLRGRNGKTRKEHWNEYGHKATYKSVAMHGFPNFFYILGPNSGRLHTSTIQIIERRRQRGAHGDANYQTHPPPPSLFSGS
ncbi:hypothetical protein UA08_05020 [Talaromyces atroroseus]|uniref:L-ornithine N(5)-monooxygenase n=1 Tax=Talaromyces atroroseus TaxID=1441469 RepID=A0A225AFD4_TALAT|nr:hypothetical protein UA08_05020 [Talaromyces atroroseus]OKL59290.1 hypothetical protein UA08_05020 [Talaromyces atroroseus]